MTELLVTERNPWIVGKNIPGQPDIRLYCFPHSGGLPSEYVRWGRELPGVQVYGICPPGKGGRIAESPRAEMSDLVTALLDSTEFNPPFVFFGHSLGALIAFEVARKLRALGRNTPDRLILSAYPAADLTRTAAKLHTLPDDELVKSIGERYGGIPPQVLAAPELVALLLPAFRADFTILENYRYAKSEPLPMPLEVFGGDQDAVTFEELEQWRCHTTAHCRIHSFSGGHFYFRENPPALNATLRAILDSCLPVASESSSL